MDVKKTLPLIIIVAIVCIILAYMGFTHVDNEQLLREGVAEELDLVKTHDQATISEVVSGVEELKISQLETYGIDADEFLDSYLQGFDYTIDDVTVTGNTAEVTVTLTCKRYSDFEDAIDEVSEDLTSDDSIAELAELSEDEVNDRIGEAFMGALDGLEVYTTDPIVLNYQLIDSTWTPTEEAQSTISSALFS